MIWPSAGDGYVQKSVTASGNARYIAYERTYKGLPVVGGDFVVVTDKTGAMTATSVAQTRAIGDLATAAKIRPTDAETVARRQLSKVDTVGGTHLVVDALDGAARLAYETTVSGMGAAGVSRLSVDVDAISGAVLHTTEHVLHGTGTGWINGSVTINTTQSGGTFRMQDPSMPSLACQDAANNTTFSGADDVWGNGVSTNRETGCVDAFYVAQQEAAMLSSWLGRNGMDGAGGAWPIRVGLNDENAFYDGSQVQIGHNTAGAWISSADVVGHEMGHGVDDHTPGGISRGGTQEFVADTFGAATEWFANNPNDPPDYLVGEKINLLGTGPIRNMYNPSAVGDPNCYSSSTPNQEVHAAAGPGDHWFYLVAQGSAGNGQPASPTCDGSTVGNPLGIQNAMKIMYNAMLMKTSTSSYLKYRTWTLTAAMNLFPGSCSAFNTVKAAWDAVSVPAQPDDPTCTVFGSSIAAARNADGRLLLLGTNSLDNIVYRTQTAPDSWDGSGWQVFDGSLRAVAAETNSDGRVELFGVNSVGAIVHRVQTTPGNWGGSGWQVFDGELASIAAARNADGRLEIFGANSVGAVVHRVQSAPGDWGGSGWQVFDGSLTQVAAETNSDGKVELFGVNSVGAIVHRVQSTPGTWGGSVWQVFDGVLRP
ncbi:MAG TPA: M4 family metallopeptidase [Rugosimonospora sp.]|nr:M4 family metallopeptidase [Rugosimonospora sp.]